MHSPILTLNAGSSSLKFAVFRAERAPTPLARGLVDSINHRPTLSVRDLRPGSPTDPPKTLADGPISYEEATAAILGWCRSAFGPSLRPAAIGHRVVHGGPSLDGPRLMSDALLADLRAIVPLAPLHQPQSLAVIVAATREFPEVPHVCCFDTAFHRTMPPVAQAFAIPHRLTDEGVCRYGFHGLSFEFIAAALPSIDPRAAGEGGGGRTVVAHLGNGASLCAMHNRRSVATSMGLSALDGLVMGTRCGALDPGVVFYLHERHGMSFDDVRRTLYKESGLLGVSGLSADVRDLMTSPDPRAGFALDLFAYRASREIASHAAAMQGLDAVVFTGGIGEHAAPVRAAICEGCRWLGLEIDGEANDAGGPRISAASSRVTAWVVPTDEEAVIARHAAALISIT